MIRFKMVGKRWPTREDLSIRETARNALRLLNRRPFSRECGQLAGNPQICAAKGIRNCQCPATTGPCASSELTTNTNRGRSWLFHQLSGCFAGMASPPTL